MPITSHFIGITLKSEPFADLFKKLKKYFDENKISNAVKLQNLGSLHLTVYYLSSDLKENTLSQIKKDLKILNQKPLEISIIDGTTFQSDSKTTLVYLPPTNQESLLFINNDFKNKYPNSVPDNQWIYMPHITIFKVTNWKIFSSHESQVIDLIINESKKIKSINIFESFNLFAVDSTISPEKQTIIT